jgi:hypothetical protein
MAEKVSELLEANFTVDPGDLQGARLGGQLLPGTAWGNLDGADAPVVLGMLPHLAAEVLAGSSGQHQETRCGGRRPWPGPQCGPPGRRTGLVGRRVLTVRPPRPRLPACSGGLVPLFAMLRLSGTLLVASNRGLGEIDALLGCPFSLFPMVRRPTRRRCRRRPQRSVYLALPSCSSAASWPSASRPDLPAL